jgi:hypothetical protein
MIRPGLLTASTNKADHFGTSGVGLVACRCIGSVLLSLRVVLVLRTGVFPSVATFGHGWAPNRHRRAERSGALRTKWRVGGWALVAGCERRRGKLTQNFSARMKWVEWPRPYLLSVHLSTPERRSINLLEIEVEISREELYRMGVAKTAQKSARTTEISDVSRNRIDELLPENTAEA